MYTTVATTKYKRHSLEAVFGLSVLGFCWNIKHGSLPQSGVIKASEREGDCLGYCQVDFQKEGEGGSNAAVLKSTEWRQEADRVRQETELSKILHQVELHLETIFMHLRTRFIHFQWQNKQSGGLERAQG